MKLPNHERAVVSEAKITQYLLSPTHPDGWSKEKFFKRFGFSATAWGVLADALLPHAADNEVVKTEESPFGTRHIVEGIVHTPDGRMPRIRSIWFIETGEDFARFVTAYPL